MEVPSGRVFTDRDVMLVKFMSRYCFVQWSDKPFKLKSGIESHVYVFGREDVTDHPWFEHDLGSAIHRFVWREVVVREHLDDRMPCLIGIPTAGTVLAQAAAMVSVRARSGRMPMCHRLMREVRKGHGAHAGSWVNGRPEPNRHLYMTVDNVITDGESKIEALKRLRNDDGYPAMPNIVLVDRQQGGVERLRELSFDVRVMFNLLDIVYVFGESGLWPKEFVRRVEEEIKAHRSI